MPRQLAPRRQTRPTVEQLAERLDELLRADTGYRRLSIKVRRALRRLLSLLDEAGSARYMTLEQAVNARDVYSTDAVAQWAYGLGLRDGATSLPRVRVRKGAMKKLTRLRRAQPK